ncbi:MAG: hypothetical protein A3C70_01190 [Candidatus Zambryskibacteria bacterium RIFCSPHIGHO2_02_FULL_43_14]|uniref:DUF1003 domain-containing protein n=1 Tax=Candidatus Zambryskibacteria bacterium RIFCSPHIGHO2_02_FULL_43_14 TaxID=1802748 RepID=A0A1G2TFH5_9BACT|nr:MAG: hypothetical protein A2829_00635 [Candidatus Zambryskibacteria bacterium RIFCSPHIGHO2_01_FULL_43_60]OHA96020.1 MAG: hypothetical protein A3C70_01190 [Candidatus Zambryskibacteria bacterium RIFCSPHIGHO2_02_FULL_43_14]OHB03093.1 MAG: hypothetical protein A3B03_01475 [Candidatus Zambryskibacteria bacterium RIFCSPLOWO2_01_FULL_42_41]
MEYKHNPPTLAELRAYRKLIKHPHVEARLAFSTLERLAIKITNGVGTIGFFFVLTIWTLVWLLWNLYGPLELRFDPAPAFVIWLFASNIIQLILLPLIMVGQNLEGKFAEQRAQADFEINQKAEHEIEVIIAHLENQNELLLELIRKIEKR